jgi:hypothetical protein
MDPELEQSAERARWASAPERMVPERAEDPLTGLQRVAENVGNRDFTRLVARMEDGEGILSGGVVHPDVERAITASRGRGAQLDVGLARNLGQAYGDSLNDVRVHTDEHAAALARAVSARAFAVGSDIFFGAGEYNPRTAEGTKLIAHEAAHVIQQRGAPATGPLTVSQPGDPLEHEAETLAGGVTD